MKYSIETTKKGCIERLEIEGKELELETVRTDFGSKGLGKCFADQLEEMGFDDETVEKIDDTFDDFMALNFIQLQEMLCD